MGQNPDHERYFVGPTGYETHDGREISRERHCTDNQPLHTQPTPAGLPANQRPAGAPFISQNQGHYMPQRQGLTDNLNNPGLSVEYDYRGDHWAHPNSNVYRDMATFNAHTSSYSVPSNDSPAYGYESFGHSEEPDTGSHTASVDNEGANGMYTVQCACGLVLTGAHAKGNLKRHQRSQKCTASAETRSCMCLDCGQTFLRSDALLNHRRKRHGAPPGQNRPRNSG
ncbi:hypothetical protein BU23DRAFT_557881 [Bimuria novae-zelandiae CBS 107.79]|uniref:C2H2-type domain-containing protein n=1 Tax=Bimuria novae-zelandiae CBS 107.79 TaxID=1447943 RepID=A0A6A5UZF3_9PLEO|nr:hypothetical protein BU23DRAFT_557881 [Bimuria novae-zelandiae CBS 107.79]